MMPKNSLHFYINSLQPSDLCDSTLGLHWFWSWLVAYSVPSHYLNQCWPIVNWTLGNKFQWNLHQYTKQYYSYKKMDLKMSSATGWSFYLGTLVCVKWLSLKDLLKYLMSKTWSSVYLQMEQCWQLSLACFLHIPMVIDSLWPSDVTWRHRFGSTLAEVMAWCLTAPSHYMNKCWLIISKVLCQSSNGIIIRKSEDINMHSKVEICIFKIAPQSPRDQWVKDVEFVFAAHIPPPPPVNWGPCDILHNWGSYRSQLMLCFVCSYTQYLHIES